MCHRANIRYIKILSSKHQRCPPRTTDERGTRGKDSCISAVCSPRAEVEYRFVSRGSYNSRGFRGNQRLKVHHTEQIGLKKLHISGATRDIDNGFIGKNKRAFRDSENGAIKAEVLKVGKVIRTQVASLCQPVKCGIGEA